LFTCSSNDECSSLTDGYCNSGTCEEGPAECTNSQECVDFGYSYCDADTLLCVTGTDVTTCIGEEDTCSDLGDDYYCDTDILNCDNEAISCTTSDDCSAAFGEAGYCDIETSTCKGDGATDPCESDTDCEDLGYTCNTGFKTCEQGEGGEGGEGGETCSTDSDCGGEYPINFCNSETNLC